MSALHVLDRNFLAALAKVYNRMTADTGLLDKTDEVLYSYLQVIPEERRPDVEKAWEARKGEHLKLNR